MAQRPGICSLWYSSYWGLVPVLLLGAMVVEVGVRPMRPSMAGLMLLALKVSEWVDGWKDWHFLGEGLHWLSGVFERHIGNWVMHGSSGYRAMTLLEWVTELWLKKMMIFKGSSSLARCRHPELHFGGTNLGGANWGCWWSSCEVCSVL